MCQNYLLGTDLYNYVYATTARYPRVIKNHKAFNEKPVRDWTMKLETFYDEGSSPGTYCPKQTE